MTSFKEVQESIELLLSVDKDAQVISVTTEWCRARNDFIYVYDGHDWYFSYNFQSTDMLDLGEGFLLTLDNFSHCGGYTASLPKCKEIPYETFKVKYSQGSLL